AVRWRGRPVRRRAEEHSGELTRGSTPISQAIAAFTDAYLDPDSDRNRPMTTGVTTARAERRLFGLDVETIGPALLVLALAAVMSFGVPSIDSNTSYNDEVHRGDLVRLTDSITLVPAA